MAISTRLTATFAFKAAGAVPKILYLGYDAEEAKAAFEAAKDKGYAELKVCRNLDVFFISRWKAEPVKVE
jgi:hypothetical protein